jgi:predicted transcriptional regulator
MDLSIHLPPDIDAALREQAHAAGSTPEALAERVVERHVRMIAEFRAATAPIHEAFKASGMTEDEAVELFEAEKHAMRAERRKKAS